MVDNIIVLAVIIGYILIGYYLIKFVRKKINHLNVYLQFIILSFVYTCILGLGIGEDHGFPLPFPIILVGITCILEWSPTVFFINRFIIPFAFWWVLIFIVLLVKNKITGKHKQTSPSPKWSPISLDKLYEQIKNGEIHMDGELWNFWQLIKIEPVKWVERQYGNKGGGFWVVAICGTKVIWYNDIEEGFNISEYKTVGQIEEYYCNQDELNWSVIQLFDLVKLERQKV